MCGTCGLPATHTGATTLLVSSVLPIILIYVNLWFVSTKLLFVEKFRTSAAKTLTRPKQLSLLIGFVIALSSPWWLEQLYWYTSFDQLYYVLDWLGPRIWGTIFVLITTLFTWYCYWFKVRARLLFHLGIIASVESIVLVGSLLPGL